MSICASVRFFTSFMYTVRKGSDGWNSTQKHSKHNTATRQNSEAPPPSPSSARHQQPQPRRQRDCGAVRGCGVVPRICFVCVATGGHRPGPPFELHGPSTTGARRAILVGRVRVLQWYNTCEEANLPKNMPCTTARPQSHGTRACTGMAMPTGMLRCTYSSTYVHAWVYARTHQAWSLVLRVMRPATSSPMASHRHPASRSYQLVGR